MRSTSSPRALFAAAAAALCAAGCPCAQLPVDGRFACESEADCLKGAETCHDGYCWPIADASVALDAATLGKDAQTVEPPDAAAEEPDAEVSPGRDARVSRPDAAAPSTDGAVGPGDAGHPDLDGAVAADGAIELADAGRKCVPACDPATADQCVNGACLCGNGTACTSGRRCQANQCQCAQGQTECGAGCCGAGEICDLGMCFACGQAGQRCCGEACAPGTVCLKGMCEKCGELPKTAAEPPQPCCAGDLCNAGFCSAGTCLQCGRKGDPCCPGDSCLDPFTTCNVLGKCAPCGEPNFACCPGNGCASNYCCSSAGLCTAPGLLCDLSATCCGGATAGSNCVQSCEHADQSLCGGPSQPCCSHTVGTTVVRYCSAPLTVCDPSGQIPSCLPCGLENQPCCAGATCFDSVCIKAVTPPTCSHCGVPGESCCPGMHCDQGCCNPENNLCVDPGQSCGQWGFCSNSGRCADCGNLGLVCCPAGAACLTGYSCDVLSRTCR
ncbi:MAG TPA: hypothetical protein VGK67_15780 [Myxococcales bacterium]|jgi:hypothetical protein